MCNYCNKGNGNAKILKSGLNSIDVKRYPFFDKEMYALCVRLLDHDASYVVRINYCPMCGKRLGE
jgi:hypothetical protein